MVAVPPLLWPQPINCTTNVTGSLLIDAAGEKAGLVFVVPRSGTLRSVGFGLQTVTTGQPLKVSFQDVDLATGFPDGGVDQFRVVSVADNDDNTWKTTGIVSSDGTDTGTKRSVTAGQLLAIVIEFDSAIGNLQVTAQNNSNALPFLDTAYGALFTAAWAMIAGAGPIFALEYDTGIYAVVDGVYPSRALQTTVAVNTGTTPDEYGIVFVPPVPMRVAGACWFADRDGDTDVVLYDASSNVLRTGSLDKDVRQRNGNNQGAIRFSSEVDLVAGQTYRLVFKPTSVTSVTAFAVTLASSAYLASMPGGSSMYRTGRTDAGAWVDTNTEVPWMGLILSGFDSGGSGVSRARSVNHGGL